MLPSGSLQFSAISLIAGNALRDQRWRVFSVVFCFFGLMREIPIGCSSDDFSYALAWRRGGLVAPFERTGLYGQVRLSRAILDNIPLSDNEAPEENSVR